MSDDQTRVVIGMDPHKRSVTIEGMTADEAVLAGGRFGTDGEGYRQLFAYVAGWPVRVWAIEGCRGIGRHVAHRLLADGEGRGRATQAVCTFGSLSTTVFMRP